MDLRERIAGLMGQARAELAELVAIPSVADMVWSRPAVTILGIDCPPVVG